MPASPSSRLAYIDWTRGLACVLMFQTHCYDAWLGGNARKGTFFMWSQLLGTFPAPLFLFLAGISVALMADKLWNKKVPSGQIAQTVIKRGAEILVWAFLFRLQEFVIALGWAPWTDLLRVDILNTIGVSIMLLGLLVWAALPLSEGRQDHVGLATASALMAILISVLTPLLWTSWRPNWLPWPLLSYIDGSHNVGLPQSGLFPVFPWSGFAFAGLAVGLCLAGSWVHSHEAASFALAAGGGVGLICLGRWLDGQRQLYGTYDFWHTSPNFFLIRVGYLLAFLGLAYAWCRWGAGQWGFRPLVQMGQASLLVYWVHLEFVYGKFSILPRRAEDISTTTFGLLVISVAMLLLAVLRNHWRGRSAEVFAWLRLPAAGKREVFHRR